MSLLNGSAKTHTEDEQPNKWAGRVRAVGAVPAWWQSSTTLGVVEVSIGPGLFTLLVQVNRSAKSGRYYASAPASKRGDEWIPNFVLEDGQLEKAVSAVAIAAWQACEVQATPAQPVPAGAAHTVETEPDFPF